MIQTSIVAPHPPSAPLEDDQAEPLLQLAGDPHHALIVADHALGLVCGLIRRGCAAATTVRPGEKPDADNYDLILLPQAAAFASPEDIVRFASRCLAPDGRMVVGAASTAAASALGRRLRLNGFAVSASHGRSKVLCAARRVMS